MLRDILDRSPLPVDPNVLVGHAGADDAGVYRLSDDTALVLTLDFFTPIVDDARDYGRVAGANSLSDVYAMGAKPLVALNIACFPEGKVPEEVIADILLGGADAAADAGIAIVGGHTVKDEEIKYGLSVVGVVQPDRVVQNSGAQVGDCLVLTKALGVGHLTSALKAGDLDARLYPDLIATMTRLNRSAGEAMIEQGAHACTDITGNGLLGHAFEMALASDVTMEFDAGAFQVLPGTREAVARGHITAGGATNRDYTRGAVTWAGRRDETLEHILYDPQTSGGLLIALPEGREDALMGSLLTSCPDAAIVGRVVAKGAGIRLL